MMVVAVPHPSEIKFCQIFPSQFKQKRLFAFIVAAENAKIIVPALLNDIRDLWQNGEVNIRHTDGSGFLRTELPLLKRQEDRAGRPLLR